MPSCNNAFQEFYYMEHLKQLSRLTGCYGNQQCLTIIHGFLYSAHIFLDTWSRKTNEIST